MHKAFWRYSDWKGVSRFKLFAVLILNEHRMDLSNPLPVE